MAPPTRRDMLAASGAALAALPGMSLAAAGPADRIEADLARYIGFGIKASGGAGDAASGAWIEAELQAAGYAVARQLFEVPFFAANTAELRIPGGALAVLPHAPAAATPGGGVTGPLVRVDPASVGVTMLDGAIALVDLPHQRWSSALARPIADTLAAAWARGAAAAVVITNGPTGEAIALNARAERDPAARPVAILAPRLAPAALRAAAQGARASLLIAGEGGRRTAFNLIGRIDRGSKRWIVLSTPRSGWFGCAGERGPGIAVWLALARWAAAGVRDHNLAFLCTSGHEYEYLGAEHAFAAKLPPEPGDTALWLHLGANVAARDWQDLPGGTLLPLPSADPQRFLVASPALVPAARAAFAGQPGLESAYPVGAGTAGELTGILGAGYAPVAGIFGGHRFHHVVTDDARCVAAPLVARVIESCKALIAQA